MAELGNVGGAGSQGREVMDEERGVWSVECGVGGGRKAGVGGGDEAGAAGFALGLVFRLAVLAEVGD